jgi:hypothetical protein
MSSTSASLLPEHFRYLRDPEFVAYATRNLRRKTKPQIRWTSDRVKFLREHYPDMILPRLTRAFNDAFGVTVTEKAIGFQLSWRSIRKTVRPTVGPHARRRRRRGAVAA